MAWPASIETAANIQLGTATSAALSTTSSISSESSSLDSDPDRQSETNSAACGRSFATRPSVGDLTGMRTTSNNTIAMATAVATKADHERPGVRGLESRRTEMEELLASMTACAVSIKRLAAVTASQSSTSAGSRTSKAFRSESGSSPSTYCMASQSRSLLLTDMNHRSLNQTTFVTSELPVAFA